MSFQATLNGEELELLRLARILGKHKVIELLRTAATKNMSIEKLINIAKAEISEEKTIQEALSFILSIIKEKFPEIEIPQNLKRYIKTLQKMKKSEEQPVGIPKKGEITPRRDYVMPIMEALIEMGGRGETGEVLIRVFEKIKDKLKQKDLEILPSGREKRWRNHARWESLTLAKEGYIRKSGGIWEITEKGIKLYEEQKATLQPK
jgi:hypothetical protein